MRNYEMSFRFIYRSGTDTPSTAPSDDNDSLNFSSEAVNLPVSMMDDSIRISNGQGLTRYLRDCIAFPYRDNPNNPLYSYEGAMTFLREVAKVSPNYPRMNELMAAISAKFGIDNSRNLSPEQIETEMVRYYEMLDYFKRFDDVILESEGGYVDLDRFRYAVYNEAVEARDNIRAMTNGQKNAMAGAAMAGLFWIFASQENEIATALKDDILSMIGVASAAVLLDSASRVATGRGAIEVLEDFNRRSGESMAAYFEMPYDTREQKLRMDDVCAIMSDDHHELFDEDVTFADLHSAWKDNNVERISRRGIFAGETGARRLRDALIIIFEKFAPNTPGTINDPDTNPVVASVFAHVTDPRFEVSPMEGLIDLIISDPDAPERLMTTFADRTVDAVVGATTATVDYVSDVGSDVAAVAMHHVLHPAFDIAKKHIDPVLAKVADAYTNGRLWLDEYADYVRGQRNRDVTLADEANIPDDFYTGLSMNEATPEYPTDLPGNVMHLGLMPPADIPSSFGLPFSDVEIPFDAAFGLQTAFVVNYNNKRYLVTPSRLFEYGIGNWRLMLRSDEDPVGFDLSDATSCTFEEQRTTIVELPDNAFTDVVGLNLSDTEPTRGDPVWRIYDDHNGRPREIDGSVYAGTPGDSEAIFGSDANLQLGENWFSLPQGSEGGMSGAPVLDDEGRVLGMNLFDYSDAGLQHRSVVVDADLVGYMIQYVVDAQ